MSSTLVIAEPGCTHEGDYHTLMQLLEAAHACGADVFKPQWVSDPDQMIARRHVPPSVYRKCYGWLNFPVEWHADCQQRCHALGLRYACTAFLPQDVATLAPFVDVHKVSSFEAGDPQMIAAHHRAGSRDRLLVSTGMVEDVDELQNAWRGLGADFLQCVSAYPTPLSALNLLLLHPDDRSMGPCVDGLSDHSRHLLTGAVAVACGADIVETHFRLDDCDSANPDYAVAFSPAEFTQYIQNIRDADLMLGDGVKTIQPCEVAMLPYRVVP